MHYYEEYIQECLRKNVILNECITAELTKLKTENQNIILELNDCENSDGAYFYYKYCKGMKKHLDDFVKIHTRVIKDIDDILDCANRDKLDGCYKDVIIEILKMKSRYLREIDDSKFDSFFCDPDFVELIYRDICDDLDDVIGLFIDKLDEIKGK